MQKVIRNYLQTLTIFSALVLVGCSTTPDESMTSESQPIAKEQMVIETSQGVQTLTPTVVTYDPVTFDDPLESINRPIFAFNDVVFRYFLIPVSKGYNAIVPTPVKSGVSNFFDNLREPLNLLNNLAQGEGRKSGVNLSRFLINSTVGVLGLFDPADAWFDLKEQRATIGDTLASYDVGYGNYLVLPFLGQSDYRNAFSTIGETFLSPVQGISDPPQTTYLQVYDGFNDFAPTAPTYEELRAQSDDPYVFFRNLYLQSVERDQQFEASPSDAPQQFSPSPANTVKKPTDTKQPKDTEQQEKNSEN